MRRLILFASLALLPLSAWADVLVMRDGGRHTGKFISGSGDTITFQDNTGQRRQFSVRDVQSLQFETLGSSRALPTRSYNTDNSGGVQQARSIPAGTSIVVRSNESIDSTTGSEGRSYPATVDRDVTDSSGSVIVPRGSDAELVVRSAATGGTTGSPELVLDLQSLKVNGQRYLVSTQDLTESNQQGLGKNRRTATMVGGGAVLGTLLGAIAGGGKGAAIGAAAGAATGAGVQVLTRGKEVKVPAETQLTFQLDKPLSLVADQR